MGIGLSGMISGLDTDSLIKQLMSAERTRVTKVDNKITKNEWLSEKWKSLNTKIYSLYTGSLSKMKTQGNYLTKKTTSSNDKILSVKAGSSAPVGTHYITVDSVASSQYVTGGKFTSDKKMTSKSKLVDAGVEAGTKITLKSGDKTKEFIVDENTTFADFSEAGKEVGLNINLDENRQALYINSRQSGTENKFSITTSSTNSANSAAKKTVRDLAGYGALSTADKASFDAALTVIEGSSSDEISDILDKASNGTTLTDAEKKVKDAYDTVFGKANDKKAGDLAQNEVKAGLASAIQSAMESGSAVTLYGKEFSAEDAENLKKEAQRMAKNEHEAVTFDSVYGEVEDLKGVSYADIKKIEAKEAEGTELSEDEQKKLTAFRDSEKNAEFTAALGTYDEENGYSGAGYDAIYNSALKSYAEDEAENFLKQDEAKTAIEGRKNAILAAGNNAEITAMQSDLKAALNTVADVAAFDDNGGALAAIGLANIDGSAMSSSSNAVGMTVFEASDAKVTVNGATIESSSNTISVNGLTIDVLSANPGETVSVTVSQNTDSVYDMVKQFVKDYNELLDEMNNAYYAESARGYNPLTDEQKDAMSDSEVEKWENKIKDSLLRRDNTLGSLITSMRSVLNESVSIDGKSYSFASFGVTTTKYSEKGKLHIYGDQDDSEGMTYDDKLRKAIEDDPEKVMEVLQTISKKLYDTMGDKMKATELSSALTFYNDKQLTKDMTSYKKEKTKEEGRLQEIEDRYYKQFASMEKALSNLSTQSSSLLSMLGMNYQ